MSIAPSDLHITVQFDTTRPVPQSAEFFTSHPCLDDTATIQNLGRGFAVYGLTNGWTFASAHADIVADQRVRRCYPVYVNLVDAAEIPVTDLISAQFNDDVSIVSALGILSGFGLHFVDSSNYRHLFWKAALDDTILDSPLEYANALHLRDETEWATPTMYVRPILMSLPADSFFQFQYYLRNTGQTGGVSDCDIDADSAWLFALADSSLFVAVIDEGVESQEDLSGSGLAWGRDFTYQHFYDPTPGTYRNHGMACAGIIAGVHNTIGVAGVNPGCTIVPIKIFDDQGNGAEPDSVADAIYYVNSLGCPVASNSWAYGINPVPQVESAIKFVSNGCGGLSPQDPEARRGTVMVFAAGNFADLGDPVLFPANMPEVIAVGAIDKSNTHWHYSCKGSALDVVAPSGDVNKQGDMYTADMTGDRGWNPHVTGASRDAGLNHNYTRAMGGTSGACPEVAGIVSLLMACPYARTYGRLNPCNPTPDVLDILQHTSDNLGPAGWDDSTGWGRANAFKAVVSISHGDMNGDAAIDIVDVVGVVNVAFRGEAPPALFRGLPDLNCDGFIDVLDVVKEVGIAFRGSLPDAPCYRFNY